MSGAEAGGARVAVLGLGASGAQASDLTVGAIHHLHKLSTLEHEKQVGAVLQQPRVEALGCLNGFTHPAFQHQLLDFLSVLYGCLLFLNRGFSHSGKSCSCGTIPMMHQVRRDHAGDL